MKFRMDAGQDDAGQDSKLQERRLCSHGTPFTPFVDKPGHTCEKLVGSAPDNCVL